MPRREPESLTVVVAIARGPQKGSEPEPLRSSPFDLESSVVAARRHLAAADAETDAGRRRELILFARFALEDALDAIVVASRAADGTLLNDARLMVAEIEALRAA